MNFDTLAAFQDSLIDLGIGGNDCAVYVDSKPVYRHFSGWQNMEEGVKINENTLYRMFSMSKPITCTAAMQLFEQGKFLLNDPLSDYLPEYADVKVEHLMTDASAGLRPASEPVRVEHLFMMAAGLDYNMASPAMQKLIAETKDGQFTTRELARALAQNPLHYEPGSHFLYSMAHDVLGALIEVISGKNFYDYLVENIFNPLGMHDSWFHNPASEEARVCHRYGFDENGKLVRGDEVNHLQPSVNFCSGGAGLTMTLDDYAKFACAMTNRGISADGKRILAGRTVDLMRTNRMVGAQATDYDCSVTRAGYGYGLGVRTLINPAKSGSTSSVGEFGWGGAWGTFVLMDPASKVTLVYAEQGVDTKGPYIQRRLRNIAYAALEWEGYIQ